MVPFSRSVFGARQKKKEIVSSAPTRFDEQPRKSKAPGLARVSQHGFPRPQTRQGSHHGSRDEAKEGLFCPRRCFGTHARVTPQQALLHTVLLFCFKKNAEGSLKKTRCTGIVNASEQKHRAKEDELKKLIEIALPRLRSAWHCSCSRAGRPPTPTPASAPTSGCVDHAEILGLHRNVATVGPCEDFGEFVCSHWREKNVKVVPSVMIFRMGKWLLSLARTRWYEETGHPVAKRVTRLADACMRLETEPHIDDVGVAQLFHFITQELFPWILPEANAGNALLDDYAFALATIVNMSVVWNMPLWFTVDLVRLGTEGDALPANWSVSVSSASVVYMSMRLQRTIEEYNLYNTYVILLLANVFQGEQLAASFHSFLESKERPDAAGRVRQPVVTLPRQPTPSLGSCGCATCQRWCPSSAPATGSTRCSPPSGWTLRLAKTTWCSRPTPHSCPVSSGTIHTFIVGNKVGEEFYPVICGSQIAMAYNALLSGVDHGTAFQRAPVMRLLSDVHNTAVAKVPLLDRRARCPGPSTLSPRAWAAPAPSCGQKRNETAALIGGGRPCTVPTTTTRRVDSSATGAKYDADCRESLNTEPYQLSLRVFRIQSPYLATYDLVSNTNFRRRANCRPAVLRSRRWRAPSTPLRCCLTARRPLQPGFLRPTTPAELRDRLCGSLHGVLLPRTLPAPQRTSSLYPLLPALEIAYDAYKRFRNAEQDLPLRGLEDYSAEQVFFLTACHATCWENSSKHRVSPECSDAVRNFAPFAEAFKCPAGSPMNPRERCRLF
ncbi:hypothetical protein MRX96_027532 [Rhipicephalus microplus]